MKADSVRVILLTVAISTLAATGEAEAAWPKFLKKKNKAPATVPAGEALRVADMDAASLMARSREAEAAGKEKAALEGYRKIVQNYPYSSHAPVAQFRLAAALEKERKFERAFDEYQTLISNYRQTPQFSEALDRQFNIAMMGRTAKVGRTLGFKSRMSGEEQIELLTKVINNAPQGPHAAECQYEIGRVHEEEKARDSAIAAYRKVVNNYPRSPLAREAQQKIGETYMAKVEKGSRDMTNAARAREAATEAEAMFGNNTPDMGVGAISEAETESAYKTGKFYQKQGKYQSAIIYYADVLKNPASPYHDEVKARIEEMSAKDPTVKDTMKRLALNTRRSQVPAGADTRGLAAYFGPPGPSSAAGRAPQGGVTRPGDFVPLAPLEPGELPASPAGGPDPSLLDPSMLPPVDPNLPLNPPALEPPLEMPPAPSAPEDAAGAVEEKKAIPVENP